jgi:ring-1,2-phenylacetyl-CoA epoxidase subunit PaaC
MREPLFEYVLRLADDALVLGHRLSQWSGRAPTLEEDIALSNLALDLIGQARFLYTLAGQIEGRGRGEDQFAYFREAHEFKNCLLVEQPNGDFATTVSRQFLYAAFMHPYWEALTRSHEQRLAQIALKAVKEIAYHVRHAGEWVIRLGDGTHESRRRMVAALDELWMYTGELLEMDETERRLMLAAIAPDRARIRPAWERTIAQVLATATLERPTDRWMQSGGRSGRHTEHLGLVLAEMQVLARAHPQATW